MSRLEFMKQLARLLDDLPKEEKIEILKYYNGYFDDAGEENEAAIIAELGSPEKVASEVKAGVQSELERECQTMDSQNSMEAQNAEEMGQEWMVVVDQTGKQTSDSYEQTTGNVFGKNDVEEDSSYSYESQNSSRHKKANGWKTIAIIAILMLTFPIWIGLLGGLIGLLGGSIGIIVAVVVGLFGALIGLVGAAIGCIVGGIGALLTMPISGVLSLAVGIFLLGLLLLVGLVIGKVFGKVIPGIVKVVGKLFGWAGKTIGDIVNGMTGRR